MHLPETQGFSAQTARQFDEISDALAALFAPVGKDSIDYEIQERSSNGSSVDFVILNYDVIAPTDVEARFSDILAVLRSYEQFWCVRFWVYKPSQSAEPDECIWLEINKYGVAPYCGMKFIEVFRNMDELYTHYWGKTF